MNEYDRAVFEIQKSVREMKESGTNFSKKSARETFKKNLVQAMKRVANDKRIFE